MSTWRESHGAAVAARYLAGEPLQSIAVWLGTQGTTVSKVAIHYWLKREGIKRASRPPRAKRAKGAANSWGALRPHAAQIREMHAAGKGPKLIAEAISTAAGEEISEGSVSAWMWRNLPRPGRAGHAERTAARNVARLDAIMADGRARTFTDMERAMAARGWSCSGSSLRRAVAILVHRGTIQADPHKGGLPSVYAMVDGGAG
jgi:hypothetical protein